MRSSADKHRDMARSILPSRARSISARLALTRRAARRRVRHELSSIVRGHGGWEECEERSDLRAYPDIEIAMLVYWRRAADKLNHFERWAVQVTRDLPVEARLGHMRSVLPGGLIGDHAMSHLRWLPELNPDSARRASDSLTFRELRRADAQVERDGVRRLLVALLEAGGHAALNSAIKAAAREDEQPRTLLGIHDVDAFLGHVLAQRRGLPVDDRWRRVVEATGHRVLGHPRSSGPAGD
jgi:hypothetical protein